MGCSSSDESDPLSLHGARLHSIWNQISIFVLRVTPLMCAASVLGQFF